jgi:hypothetical protein
VSIDAVATVTKYSKARRGARLVLLAIAQSVAKDSDTTLHLSVPRIAERCALSPRMVQYHLRTLEIIGEIEILVPDGGPGYARQPGQAERIGRGHAHRFRLLIDKQRVQSVAPFTERVQPIAPFTGKGAISDKKGCNGLRLKGAMDCTQEEEESSLEPRGQAPYPPEKREVGGGTPSASAAAPPQARARLVRGPDGWTVAKVDATA